MPAQWLQVTLTAPTPEHLPRLEAWLIQSGIRGWEERGNGALRFYLSPQETNDTRVGTLRKSLPGGVQWAGESVDEEDWAEGWKQYFKPLLLTRHLAVCPTWEVWDPPADVKVIRMDPGMAFGTGGHATTRLCLELVERYLKPDAKLLDVGTGSGILAIGALHLGASHVLCIDSDPLCVDIAPRNMGLNGFEGRFTCLLGSLLQPVRRRKFHLIVSNILTVALIELAPHLRPHLSKNGVFVGGGTTVDRLPEVMKALESGGLSVLESRTEGEWAAVAARRIG